MLSYFVVYMNNKSVNGMPKGTYGLTLSYSFAG